jgi:aminoglycoside phosphotransferase (APT) family kinase protein
MRWVPDPSPSSARAALAASAPLFAGRRIDLADGLPALEPEWSSSTAVVDGAFVLKFAWSEVAARRIRREALVLEALARVAPELPVPRLVGISDDPVAFVTSRVSGEPLDFDAGRISTAERDVIAGQLGRFLAALHDAPVLDAVPDLVTPEPQAATDAIRERLPRFLDPRRSELVLRWCDWADEVLGARVPEPVLVHGDFHGHNQVWERVPWRLLLVADFESAGPAEPEFDFRYLPSPEITLGLVSAVRDAYVSESGREIDMNRVLAWNVRTALGDALWRSEAGVALPGGGTPESYVDDLERKLPE